MMNRLRFGRRTKTIMSSRSNVFKAKSSRSTEITKPSCRIRWVLKLPRLHLARWTRTSSSTIRVSLKKSMKRRRLVFGEANTTENRMSAQLPDSEECYVVIRRFA